jgi:hypothetical protein
MKPFTMSIVTVCVITFFSWGYPTISIGQKHKDSSIQQAELAKVAIEAKDYYTGRDAVRMLTDQALLAKVAIEGIQTGTRQEAVAKVTDQAVLANLAIEDKDSYVRKAAVLKLTDQALLAKLAMVDDDEGVKYEAIKGITEQALRAKVREDAGDRIKRAQAVAALDESDPILKRLAGDLRSVNREARTSIARIKLAIQEPRIKSKFPRLQCVVDVSEISQDYGDHFSSAKFKMGGEHVVITLRQDGETFGRTSWSTNFPGSASFLRFQHGAQVSGEDLLEKLFQLNAFMPEDLAELVHSNIPEVRIAAVAHFSDPALLTKLATEDKDSIVRKAAKRRIAELQQ